MKTYVVYYHLRKTTSKSFSGSHEFKEIFQAKRFWCIESVPKHVTITLDQGSFIALGNVFTIFFTFYVQSLHLA